MGLILPTFEENPFLTEIRRHLKNTDTKNETLCFSLTRWSEKVREETVTVLLKEGYNIDYGSNLDPELGLLENFLVIRPQGMTDWI